MPSETLKPISGPWPFAQWGMDIVGPLPAAPAQKKFLLVATDYFSKWVEAEAYASIKDKDVTKFVWKNIVCRFGIPQTIIADNGPQFDSIAFRNFCSELNIRNSYFTPRYPQSNGQAEATNKTLITALKKMLEQAKGKWVEELPDVLWAYRTTPGRPTGNTPFALAYGMDAVIPTEIGLPTIWTEAAKLDDASMEIGRNLDWADEVREKAAIRMADYQQRASAHYNRKVKPRSFKNGTLVLRKVFENTAEMGAGKFQANWEGPYIVSKSSQKWNLSSTKARRNSTTQTMECVQFKAVLSIKEHKTGTNENKECFINSCKGIYKEVSGLQKLQKEDSSKDYKKKNCQGAGLSSSFFSSPGGIEGTSRLMPFFFIQQR
ncbi:Gag-Pol polyprotein [Vitis vinifera]|uniref:Gag-Pol polyprotein n=1 Tax=Vitis vinifera TaxID=29760 RepID=A0A438DUT6_VITVI|nr:Gag-Pol polyprotein [Vitis vinifera]